MCEFYIAYNIEISPHNDKKGNPSFKNRQKPIVVWIGNPRKNSPGARIQSRNLLSLRHHLRQFSIQFVHFLRGIAHFRQEFFANEPQFYQQIVGTSHNSWILFAAPIEFLCRQINCGKLFAGFSSSGAGNSFAGSQNPEIGSVFGAKHSKKGVVFWSGNLRQVRSRPNGYINLHYV